ncbi:MAG: hypothetical protein LBS06_04590 [Treponema sp.]|jgi:hypothetical protein|nr:hypothetical protein [Treponema sp.]
MPNPELARTLDYILNRCDEKSIDVVAEAVVRRRRELTMFGGSANLPDPRRMAANIGSQINIGPSIEGLRESIREMAVRIVKQEAPELDDGQIDELVKTWVPGGGEGSGSKVPPDMLQSMIDQFVSFSRGTMNGIEEKGLRDELGAWPDRYWKAFPQVIRLVIRDYLKGEMGEKEFKSRISAALAMGH